MESALLCIPALSVEMPVQGTESLADERMAAAGKRATVPDSDLRLTVPGFVHTDSLKRSR
ncbi:hypothetical protein GCM10011586_14150 [Silvibacterium dinghuense]|nr:hypothetical protein GCM10011586_14150 [Silvibacterium dinghuense]